MKAVNLRVLFYIGSKFKGTFFYVFASIVGILGMENIHI